MKSEKFSELNDIKCGLNSQIQDAINTAIAENNPPSIQNTLDTQRRANSGMMDQRSSERYRSPEFRDS